MSDYIPDWVEHIGSFVNCSKCLAGVSGGTYYRWQDVEHNDGCPAKSAVTTINTATISSATIKPPAPAVDLSPKTAPRNTHRFVLKRKPPFDPNVVARNSAGKSIEGYEIEVSDKSRYIFPIFVGDLDPDRAALFMAKIAAQFRNFFGKDTMIFVPWRKGDEFSLYEIEPIE